MGEEFQAGICGDNSWWNSTRSLFPMNLMMGSTCSVAANDHAGNYISNITNWQPAADFMDLKPTTTRSCADHEVEDTNYNNYNLVSNNNASLGFLDDDANNINKPQQCESSAATGTGSIFIDSTLQMMGFGLSSSTSSNWNQSLFGCINGRTENNNLNSVAGEDCKNKSSQMEKDLTCGGGGRQVAVCSSSVDDDDVKAMKQLEYCLVEQQSVMSSSTSSSNGGFLIGTSSSSSYGYPSTLIQQQSCLYDSHPQPVHNSSSIFTNQHQHHPVSYNSQQSPIWSTTVSSLLSPKQQHHHHHHFANNTTATTTSTTTFWNNNNNNASAQQTFHDNIAPPVFPSSQSQYQTPTFHDKPNNCTTNAPLNKLKREESPDKALAGKKSGSEAAFKRPRIETPSPLPTFKVRKEKLGDRITALQQLVSPFGKTDTASVLHEAIDYIKFLHDQVNVLSTPYRKSGAPIQHQQGCDNQINGKEYSEGGKQDLRSRGLCLVPISSTFPMATETTADFWTPTFGGPLIGI